jgi:hypothetical protein
MNLGAVEHLRSHQTSWGSETYLQYGNEAVVKVLFFSANCHTPFCYHLHRSKSLYVGYGKFILRCINPKTGIIIEKQLQVGCQYKIDTGVAHQIELLGSEGHIIETSKPYIADDLFLLADNLSYIPQNTVESTGPSFR